MLPPRWDDAVDVHCQATVPLRRVLDQAFGDVRLPVKLALAAMPSSVSKLNDLHGTGCLGNKARLCALGQC